MNITANPILWLVRFSGEWNDVKFIVNGTKLGDIDRITSVNFTDYIFSDVEYPNVSLKSDTIILHNMSISVTRIYRLVTFTGEWNTSYRVDAGSTLGVIDAVNSMNFTEFILVNAADPRVSLNMSTSVVEDMIVIVLKAIAPQIVFNYPDDFVIDEDEIIEEVIEVLDTLGIPVNNVVFIESQCETEIVVTIIIPENSASQFNDFLSTCQQQHDSNASL